MSDISTSLKLEATESGKVERQENLTRNIRKLATGLMDMPLAADAGIMATQIFADAGELLDLFNNPLHVGQLIPESTDSIAGAEKKTGPSLNPGLLRHKGRQYAHILIAEDNALTRALALSMIEQQGWRVTAVDSGLQAMEALRNHQFDLVIMDVHMNEMSGIEATRMIRDREEKNGGSQHVPIIALTSLDSSEDREMCLEAGMNEFISKSTHLNELIVAIGRQLAKSYVSSRTAEKASGQ